MSDMWPNFGFIEEEIECCRLPRREAKKFTAFILLAVGGHAVLDHQQITAWPNPGSKGADRLLLQRDLVKVDQAANREDDVVGLFQVA
jgi:hypothetical protein